MCTGISVDVSAIKMFTGERYAYNFSHIVYSTVSAVRENAECLMKIMYIYYRIPIKAYEIQKTSFSVVFNRPGLDFSETPSYVGYPAVLMCPETTLIVAFGRSVSRQPNKRSMEKESFSTVLKVKQI